MTDRVFVCAGVLSLAASVWAAPLNEFHDFESLADDTTSVSGWTFGSTATGRVIKVEADTANKVGEKSLAILDTESAESANLSALHTLGQQDKVELSMDLWVASLPTVTTEFSIMLRSSTGAELARLNIGQPAADPTLREIRANIGTTPTLVGSFEFNQRIPILITADSLTDRWSVSVNGGTAAEGRFKNNVTADNISDLYLRIQGASSASKVGQYYIDNVSLVPEPGLIALAVSGVGLLAMRRRRTV